MSSRSARSVARVASSTVVVHVVLVTEGGGSRRRSVAVERVWSPRRQRPQPVHALHDDWRWPRVRRTRRSARGRTGSRPSRPGARAAQQPALQARRPRSLAATDEQQDAGHHGDHDLAAHDPRRATARAAPTRSRSSRIASSTAPTSSLPAQAGGIPSDSILARWLERDEHVDELVLDRLERADRHAELHAVRSRPRGLCRGSLGSTRPRRARSRASSPRAHVSGRSSRWRTHDPPPARRRRARVRRVVRVGSSRTGSRRPSHWRPEPAAIAHPAAASVRTTRGDLVGAADLDDVLLAARSAASPLPSLWSRRADGVEATTHRPRRALASPTAPQSATALRRRARRRTRGGRAAAA